MHENTVFKAREGEFTELADSFRDWLRNRNRSEQTILLYLGVQKMLFLYIFRQGLELSKLQESDIEKFFAGMGVRSKNLTGATRALYLSALKTFFRHLERAGRIKDSPVKNFECPRVESREPRVFAEEEYLRLLASVRSDKKHNAIIEVFLQTGLRISELVNLELSDLQQDGEGMARLLVRQGKGSRDRLVVLPERALGALRAWLRARRAEVGCENIFVSRFARAYSSRGMRKLVQGMFARAGLRDAKVHTLRHTFCTHQLRKGTNIYLVMRQAGHSSLSTTQKYQHLLDGWGEEIARNSL